MDPLDAMILFHRGLSLKEMADYDHCSQTAVLTALLPQLQVRRQKGRGRPKRFASQRGQSSGEIAERLSTSRQLVDRVLRVVA